jgi:hypothetical protein
VDGIQIMLDEDIRGGLVDNKMTLDRVINDRVLKTSAAGAEERRPSDPVSVSSRQKMMEQSASKALTV